MVKSVVASAFLLSLFIAPVFSDVTQHERFDENLTIRPLPDGKVVTAFTFRTVFAGALPRDPRDSGSSAQHYTLFPIHLGQILREYSISELHLSLNAGKWHYDTWGYPDHQSVGTGAELWAWMPDGGPLSIDERWIGLRNALAGLFCASLGSLDDQRTSSPVSAFPLSSVPFYGDSIPYALRYATSSSEHVCTENLTPFLKLLPCKSRAGLARLLNPQRLFDADWHGLGVHVRSTEVGVELSLGVQAVLDPVRRSGGKRRDWSLQSLFDRGIDISCPVASSSIVHLITSDVSGYELSQEPTSSSGTVNMYSQTPRKDAGFSDGEQGLMQDVAPHIGMSWPREHTFTYPVPPPAPQTPLSIKRTLYGTSQTRGVLHVSFSNNGHSPITVGYLETLPALVTLWMHTMKVDLGGAARDDLLSDLRYHPPLLLANTDGHGYHHGPSMLQAAVTIPAQGTLQLSIELSKTFLRYTEHPPDAMRGWDLPPAVLFPLPVRGNDVDSGPLWTLGTGVNTNVSSTSSGVRHTDGTDGGVITIPKRMYTPTLLVDLPTPDFSMPYNVIILSCTLMTLIFGSVFNLLTRRWIIVKVEE